mmetsp:Transcript_27180/g.68265  ORF Transcript_27180/g.68265 Transcript_27180/m.68265 type:complete len:248 (+) Transcript_27180:370-1113(+)
MLPPALACNRRELELLPPLFKEEGSVPLAVFLKTFHHGAKGGRLPDTGTFHKIPVGNSGGVGPDGLHRLNLPWPLQPGKLLPPRQLLLSRIPVHWICRFIWPACLSCRLQFCGGGGMAGVTKSKQSLADRRGANRGDEGMQACTSRWRQVIVLDDGLKTIVLGGMWLAVGGSHHRRMHRCAGMHSVMTCLGGLDRVRAACALTFRCARLNQTISVAPHGDPLRASSSAPWLAHGWHPRPTGMMHTRV